MTPEEREIRDLGRRAYNAALREGRIVPRETCEGCGRRSKYYALHGHHYAGYEGAAALMVQWLCPSCHMRTHAHGSLAGWVAAIERKLRKIESRAKLTERARSMARHYRNLLAEYNHEPEPRPTDEALAAAARDLYAACRAVLASAELSADLEAQMRAALAKVDERPRPLHEITGAAACQGRAIRAAGLVEDAK